MGPAEHGTLRVTVEDRLRRGGLGLEHRPVGDGAVPLDQRWNRAATADYDIEELPHRVCDRPVVTVDQKKFTLIVRLLGVPGEMDLADMLQRKIGEVVEGGKPVIGGGDEDVVDVEQQAAPGARNQ